LNADAEADEKAAQAMMQDLDGIEKDGKITEEEWVKCITEKGDLAEVFLMTLEKAIVEATLEEQKSARIIQARARGRQSRRTLALVGATESGKDLKTRSEEAFKKFDGDSSGFVDKEELKVYLGSETGAEKMVQDFDNIHTDGKIDLEEWTAYFLDQDKVGLADAYLQTLEGYLLTGISPNQAATTIQSKIRGVQARNPKKSDEALEPTKAD
jgi:hypothetical protein